MVEERVRLAEKWKKVRVQGGVCRFENIDVAGAHALEIRNGHLPLIGPALPEQDLAWLEAVREGSPLGDQSPFPNAQVTWLEVLEADVALGARSNGIRTAIGA